MYPQNAGVLVVLVNSTLIPHHKPVQDITSFNMAKDIWQNVATLGNVEMAAANKDRDVFIENHVRITIS